MDLLIFATAKSIPGSVLVTKDLNLRIIAASESQPVEDYRTDRVKVIDQFRGFRVVDDADVLTMSFVQNGKPLPATRVAEDLEANEAVIFRTETEDGVVDSPYRNVGGVCHPCRKDEDVKKLVISPRNVEQKIAFDLLLDPTVELVTLVGQAGCGKTLCALAAAITQLALTPRQKGAPYTKLILAKPTVEMGPGIGYLPGDMKEKMDPWLMSFYDNLDLIFPESNAAKEKGATKNFRSWDYLIESGLIEIQPLHSIRGRSIANAIIIVDEAQQMTAHEAKTVLTRLGEGSKIILCGDPYQIDRPFLDQHSNGLVYVADRMRNLENTGTVFFTKTERSRLADQAAKLL
jgi:PhoH-like ATPase